MHVVFISISYRNVFSCREQKKKRKKFKKKRTFNVIYIIRNMTYCRFLITRDGERFFTWQLSDLEGFRPNKRFRGGRVCTYVRINAYYIVSFPEKLCSKN